MSQVSRSKYDKAKSAAIGWHLQLEENKQKIVLLERELKSIRDDYEKCKLHNAELKERVAEMLDKNKNCEEEISRWKKLSEALPDQVSLDELELDNRKHLKTIKELKKQLYETEEKYKDKISVLEREKLLHEGRIQQLEEARKDLQDRYSELRQDMREQRLNFMTKKDN